MENSFKEIKFDSRRTIFSMALEAADKISLRKLNDSSIGGRPILYSKKLNDLAVIIENYLSRGQKEINSGDINIANIIRDRSFVDSIAGHGMDINLAIDITSYIKGKNLTLYTRESINNPDANPNVTSAGSIQNLPNKSGSR